MKKPKGPIGDEIAEELFSAVQSSQGRSFVSDGMGAMDRDTFFSAVRMSVWETLRTAQLMVKFLEKYDEVYPENYPVVRAERSRRGK